MMGKISKILPVGVKPKPVISLSVIGIICCVLFSGWEFLMKFFNFYGKITFYDESGNKGFYDYPKMEPLTSFNATFDVFKIFFVCMALMAVYFYMHHHIGAKSIYTMRRLKNPLELYVRCLTVPVIFILLGFALIYFMNFIYIEFYLALVPEKNLQPWWDADIWRNLL